MATVRASTANTFVAILGTVNTAAMSVSKTIDAATDGIDMFTAYIQKAKIEQSMAHKIAAKDYLDTLIMDASLAKSKREEELEKELSKNQRLAQLFTQNVTEYQALFTENKAQS